MARLIKAAYKLLDLQTFFTTGADESRAWTFRRGMKAPQTAGIIIPISSGASSVPKSSSTTTMWRWVPKRPAATRGKIGVEGKEVRGAGRRHHALPVQRVVPRCRLRIADGAPPDAVIVSC